MTQDMGSKMIVADNIFPRWEQNIPTLGTKHSQAGNKMGLRLALDELTARRSRAYGSFSTGLRLVVILLLMMIVGVGEMWGADAARNISTDI